MRQRLAPLVFAVVLAGRARVGDIAQIEIVAAGLHRVDLTSVAQRRGMRGPRGAAGAGVRCAAPADRSTRATPR